ncbi:MAG: hypothetical protein KJZ73_12990 [Pseudorhodoplanes sp.]|nr:hypothetical protein [Pseudorhodoplanes sp.]
MIELWTAFRLLPSLWQIGALFALLTVFGGAYALHRHTIYQSGYDDAISDIAARNAVAAKAVREAVSQVRACRDRGGTWNQSRGVCE